jgi:hypothetical protein
METPIFKYAARRSGILKATMADTGLFSSELVIKLTHLQETFTIQT